MLSYGDYTERCIEAAASIDAEALGRTAMGPEIGRGNIFAAHGLGVLSVRGADMHCAAKVPKIKSAHPGTRLWQEIGAIELLLGHMPEHENSVPQFMALIRVESEAATTAILTEDVTRGGELPISGLKSLRVMSDRARAIRKAFRGVKGVQVNATAIDSSLAFRVGEEERFIDFTPPPVKRKGKQADDPVLDRLFDAVEYGELTVTIAADSALGQSLELATANLA